MSEKDKRAGTTLNEESVAAYLKNHPDFLCTHPELLEVLKVPHESGGASSLLLRQVEQLREKNEKLNARLSSMISVAEENERLLKRIQHVLLSLMEAKGFASTLESLHRELKTQLGADFISLTLFDVRLDKNEGKFANSMDATADELVPLDDFRGRAVPLCGRLQAQKLSVLFPESYESIESAALMPLRTDIEWGILAVGSKEPDRFAPDMGTLFLEFLSHAIAQNLIPWLMERHEHAKNKAS